ncbi:MAG: hypothetical protein AAGG07_08560 [Planctomycetota bacterium]
MRLSAFWAGLAAVVLVTPAPGALMEPAFTYTPVEIVERDDGSLLIDDEHEVTGSGTAEDPYVVPWDLLLSASKTYRPKLDMRKLPSWAELFDGKRVRIKGYVAFPFMVTETDEMLVMLNMWDGCCIGVPPTPYDAIEVKLAEKVDPSPGGHMNTPIGMVEGTFKADPYVVNDWLIGLYLMDDAEMEIVTP